MACAEYLNLDIIEHTFSQLRNICIGQNMRIYAILPPHIQKVPVEYRVMYVVDQIMFSLTAVSSCNPNELQRAETWLVGIVQFLLTNCNEEDQTFSNVAKLFRLPYTTRQSIFEEPLSAYAALCSEARIPAAFEDYDEAVIHLLNCCGKAAQANYALIKLRKLLTELKGDTG